MARSAARAAATSRRHARTALFVTLVACRGADPRPDLRATPDGTTHEDLAIAPPPRIVAPSSTATSSSAPSPPPARASTPVKIVPPDPVRGPFVQIAAGTDLTCARTKKGEVWCWGDDAFSSRKLTASAIPAPVRMRPEKVEDLGDVVDLDVSATHGCAVTKAGTLACFRDRTVDVLPGRLEGAMRARPVAGAKGLVSVRMSVATLGMVCVLDKAGAPRCARFEEFGEELPAKLAALPAWLTLSPWRAVEPAVPHGCALTNEGMVWCWKNLLDPAKTALTGASQIASGTQVACAIADGKVRCFQPGVDGPAEVRPARDLPPARRLSVGVYHACAVVGEGQVRCWGDDGYGQSGAGQVIAGIDDAVDVAAGEFHTCAVLRSGGHACWGRNHRGQWGDGTSSDVPRTSELRPLLP